MTECVAAHLACVLVIIIIITPVLIRGETGETGGGIMSRVGDYQNAANTLIVS